MQVASSCYVVSATTAHRNIEPTTKTHELSASRRNSTSHLQPQFMSLLNEAESPLPLEPILEQQEDGIEANNHLDDDEVIMAPLSTSSRLFGRRVLRLQNRCTLPRVERADGSRPSSRELIELPSSPPAASVQSGGYVPDLEEVVSRYATPTPDHNTPSISSSPAVLAHQRRTAMGLGDRTFGYSSPASRSNFNFVPRSHALQRIAACQAAINSSPGSGPEYNQPTHRKYNSVSTLGHPRGMRHFGTFSTSTTHSHLRHKRSSTEPLDEWIEAGSPISEESSQLKSGGLPHDAELATNTPAVDMQANDDRESSRSLPPSHGSIHHQSSSETSTPQSPGESSLPDNFVDVQRPSPREMPTGLLRPSTPSGGQSPSAGQIEDFVDIKRPSSSLSSAASSDFSFVEPTRSPEPAKDILARAEGRKSAEQEIKDIEEEDFRSNMNGKAADSVALASSYSQERRFDADGCLPVIVSSDSDKRTTAPMREVVQQVKSGPSPLVKDVAHTGSRELTVGVPPHPQETPIMEEAQASVSAVYTSDEIQPVAATTGPPGTQPAQPAARLSIFKPTTVFEQDPVAQVETAAQQIELQQAKSTSSESSIPHGGLMPLAAVIIVSAWMLCALLRSLVRSMANVERVQADCVFADMIVSVMLVVATCVAFHVSLGGHVEVGEGWVRRIMEALVELE